MFEESKRSEYDRQDSKAAAQSLIDDIDQKKKQRLDHRKVPESEEERANRYYDLRDENGQLKERLQELEPKFKKMAIELTKLQENVSQTRRKNGSPHKGAKLGVDVDSIIDQNKEYKERVRRITALLNSMPQAQKARKKIVGTKKTLGYKPRKKYDSRERIIEKLSEELKDMNMQLLMMERGKTVLGGPGRELAGKESKLEKMEEDYSKLELILKERDVTFRTNKDMLTKALDDLQKKRVEILELQSKLTETEFNSRRAIDLGREVQELSFEIQDLQGRLTEIASSPFVKEAEGQIPLLKKLLYNSRKLNI